jgi:hypothetical protein
MNVDEDQLAKAVDRLSKLGNCSPDAARQLVEAAIGGAVDHAFELINGSGAVPTAMTTSKADQLRFVCERAGRSLSQREVEILFRVTSTAARTILTTMVATYEEALEAKFMDRMRGDATIERGGNDDTGLKWVIRFSESATLETARNRLGQLGPGSHGEVNSARNTLTVPRELIIDGRSVDVLGWLGLKEPIPQRGGR